MTQFFTHPPVLLILHIIVVVGVVVRVLLRRNRDPASRIAWVVLILALPLVGVMTYLLFGEVNIGRRRVERLRYVIGAMPKLAGPKAGDESNFEADVPEQYQHLFRVASSINNMHPIGGNHGQLMPDSDAAIDAMVADIDAATETVHLMFYIWLTDNNGLKVVEALKRAVRRGVTCRAMVDGLGSRALLGSHYWRDMKDAGVQLAAALPVGRFWVLPMIRPFSGRIDLRNHRKILVVDGRITYCGSQNCADPEFRIKAKYAPWVDAMIRFEGPIARQNQHVFASDWMSHRTEELNDLLRAPIEASTSGFPAQVIATGPTGRHSAMPEMFETLMFAARRELIVTTPYYVPNDSIQSALCSAAYRGVDTTVVFPARNDSWIVSAASRSYYADILEAGVKIYEYTGGLLHTKLLTLDGHITLIGSANMDRRSFDLNYENNILFYDPDLTGEVRQRQQDYIDASQAVTLSAVSAWPMHRRLWNNSIATFGPIL